MNTGKVRDSQNLDQNLRFQKNLTIDSPQQFKTSSI